MILSEHVWEHYISIAILQYRKKKKSSIENLQWLLKTSLFKDNSPCTSKDG